jgi:AICAR transformylase/IMP cyclohydrolase PurH
MMSEKNVTDLKKIYMNQNKGDFPEKINFELNKESDLRYGENPNQPAAIYSFNESNLPKLTNIRLLKTGKGGLSATNMMDVTRALDILKFFDEPSVCVMKHAIPSGFATKYNNSLVEIYKNARDADARSAFGSIVVLNKKVDIETAKELMNSYVEGVSAPEFDLEAEKILSQKKNIRLILFSNLDKIPKFEGDDTIGFYDLRFMTTARLVVQKPFLTKIKGKEDLILSPEVTSKEGELISVKKLPDDQKLKDLLTSWYINIGVRSNGIVIVKNGVSLAIGSGQQERVGAVEQAIVKAYQKAMDREKIEYTPMKILSSIEKFSSNPLKGAVISSDGFFPFRDSIDLINAQGISAVIQPGGSVKDFEVIKAINEHNMSMVFTKERCFGHF